MFRPFFRKYGWIYIPGVIFLILNSRIRTWIPKVLGETIDALSSDAATAAYIWQQVFWIFALGLLIFATQFVWRFCVIGNARRLECSLREQYFLKLQSLPVSFFTSHRSGDLIAYAINDVGAVRMTFGPVLAMSINGMTIAILSLSSMIGEINGKLTLFALLPLPITVTAIILIGHAVQKRSRRVQELFARTSGFVNESIMGARVIKTFAREKEWEKDFGSLSGEMRDANVSLNDVSSLTDPIIAVTFGVSFAVSLIYGANLVLAGAITVGELVAFQGYLALIRTPVTQFARIINRIQTGLASYRRLREIFDTPGVPPFELGEEKINLRGEIEVRDLTFTYEGNTTPALSHVSFHLPAGGMLGLAGETGSGKTTLIGLLMKFYPAPRGTIMIDGTDICDIPAHALREQIGYVPQDGFLFSDTIYNNIAFYHPGADEAAVRRAAKLSGIDEEITSFAEGYETEVGERGTHLSGGQKQRISLSRAIVRDPAMLILDDTLSAVDTVTEQRITGHLRGVLRDKTSILISHRLSSLRDADLILYFEEGAITESGTHDALMQLDGLYASTYRRQQEKGGAADAQ